MKLELSATMFEEHIALSCCEEYYLMLAKQLNIPIEYTYYNCYLHFNQVMKDFIEKDTQLIDYEGYVRVDDIGTKLGIFEYDIFKSSKEGLEQYLTSVNESQMPILVSIYPKKITGRGSVPWSTRHFLMVIGKSEEGIKIVDSFPRRDCVILEEELFNSYSGWIYTFKLGQKQIDRSNYLQLVKEKIGQIIDSYILSNKYADELISCTSIENIVQIRNALAVLRITKNQLFRWSVFLENVYSINTDGLKTEALKQYKLINKLHMFCEIFNAKQQIDDTKYKTMVYQIIEEEDKIIEELNSLLSKIS